MTLPTIREVQVSDAVTEKIVHRMLDYSKKLYYPDDLPTEHEFTTDLYKRSLFIPAGMLVVGKLHLRSCIFHLPVGRLLLIDPMTLDTSVLEQGFLGAAPAYHRKIVLALADSVCVNISRTTAMTVEAAEKELAVDTLSELNLEEGELPCQWAQLQQQV